MTREEHLKFCNICTNKSFNPKVGVICRLTGKAADFESSCIDFTEDQKQVKINKREQEAIKIETKQSINKGRTALFIIGGLYVLGGIYQAFFIEYPRIIYGIINWIIAGGFFSFGFWSYKKTFLALLSGLSLFLLLNVGLAIIDPSTILSGIIPKIIVVTYLVYSIIKAKEEESKMVNQFKNNNCDF